jgi:transcriptional regulator with XRE-family HTH domain
MEFHIAEQLKIYRIRSGRTQGELATVSGVTLPMLRKIEAREVSARESDLKKLADALGLDLVLSFRERS